MAPRVRSKRTISKIVQGRWFLAKKPGHEIGEPGHKVR